MERITKFLEFELIHIGDYNLKIYTILSILIIFLIVKTILWLIKKALNSEKSKFFKIEQGSSHALYQIIKYLFWIIAFTLILETIGVDVTVLLAGSAALLVGIGLGLQQTFNDVISGIILLVEGTTKVGDILEIDDDVVKIESIGLRTSKVQNRDNISIIIPNSLITTNKVINWSHQSKKSRFIVSVGVAYGSDVQLVIKLLEESVNEHPKISLKKSIEARLMDFGNSSLDFNVFFFSNDAFRIEKIKSEIRLIINKKFDENGVTIPFPQMDVHVKSGSLKKNK
jgi:small-conductance mechanosensitive channel